MYHRLVGAHQVGEFGYLGRRAAAVRYPPFWPLVQTRVSTASISLPLLPTVKPFSSLLCMTPSRSCRRRVEARARESARTLKRLPGPQYA